MIAQTTPPISPLPPRIQTLLASLSTIKHSLSARLLLHNLILHRGKYCLACRRRRNPSGCSRTCALQRPRGHGHVLARCDDVSARVAALRADYTLYNRVVGEMYMSKGRVSKEVLARWEEWVRALVRGCETPTERLERAGWDRVEEWGEKDQEVSFGEWEWEQAWGRRSAGTEEDEVVPEVAPEMVVGMKGERRKRKIRTRNR